MQVAWRLNCSDHRSALEPLAHPRWLVSWLSRFLLGCRDGPGPQALQARCDARMRRHWCLTWMRPSTCPDGRSGRPVRSASRSRLCWRTATCCRSRCRRCRRSGPAYDGCQSESDLASRSSPESSCLVTRAPTTHALPHPQDKKARVPAFHETASSNRDPRNGGAPTIAHAASIRPRARPRASPRPRPAPAPAARSDARSSRRRRPRRASRCGS